MYGCVLGIHFNFQPIYGAIGRDVIIRVRLGIGVVQVALGYSKAGALKRMLLLGPGEVPFS